MLRGGEGRTVCSGSSEHKDATEEERPDPGDQLGHLRVRHASGLFEGLAHITSAQRPERVLSDRRVPVFLAARVDRAGTSGRKSDARGNRGCQHARAAGGGAEGRSRSGAVDNSWLFSVYSSRRMRSERRMR
ncbi:MAG: hypothetical protein MZV64_74205 [Ignavibacteriales bacterium]|nr:hypothetical protein [Ignavibacteriales bacterium]